MTQDQITEAVAQLKTHCELKMPEYEMLSARGGLYELGYDEDAADTVLAFLFEQGFTYCLDPHFHQGSWDSGAKREYVAPDACYWGPDQLLSRLNCC